jgi:hypothetical protein
MEIWKDIKGYEGIYQASNTGLIRTVEGKTTFTQKHGVRHWKQRTIKPKGQNYKTGYRVSLWKNGKSKDFLVCRLVAYTFQNKDYNDHSETVNHIDGNRFNNNIENLEIVSQKKNNRHAFENNLIKTSKKVFIKDNLNNVILEFISQGSASRYFNKNNNFINNRINKQKYKFGNYEILKGVKDENLETKRIGYVFRD